MNYGDGAMGSMAFWYEKNNSAPDKNPTAIMNFNLWTQCKSKVDSFIDIGFKVSDISSAKKLFFFIPFESKEIEDLSLNIKDAKTISAIFNERYSVVDSSDTNSFWPVLDSNSNAVFIIYSWRDQPDSSISYTSKEHGKIIEIDVDKILKQINDKQIDHVTADKDFYFRFRVSIPEPINENTIVRKYSPANNFLQSTWATTFIVDFRFNDVRSLPDAVSQMTATQVTAFVPISKLHFFLMTKAHVDVETGAKDITLRELEENTWDSYIGEKFGTKDIVAYHCSEKRDKLNPKLSTSQWEFFAKLRVNNSTLRVLALYLYVLAGITVLLNCLSNVIWRFFTCGNCKGIVGTVLSYVILVIILIRQNKSIFDGKK